MSSKKVHLLDSSVVRAYKSFKFLGLHVLHIDS